MLAVALGFELHGSFHECKKRMILAHADAVARVKFGSALAHKNVAGQDVLAAEFFCPQALGIRVSAIPSGPAAFFGGEKLKIKGEHSRTSLAGSPPYWQAKRRIFFLVTGFGEMGSLGGKGTCPDLIPSAG